MIERVPLKTNPQLFDKAIGDLQKGLADNLKWLTHSFGKAERLVKIMPNGAKYYTPNVYVGGNEYELIAPDSGFGNYSFFTLEEPQSVDWYVGETSTLKAPFNLIVWVDMRTIEEARERNTEWIKQQVLRALNGGFLHRYSSININKIYERAENVFAGFTLDEIDNQFLMHPFAGFRFSGEMKIKDDCII